MDNYFSNKNLLDMVFKWKYHLIIIAILAGIISIVFSSPFFIHPKYKSFAVVYPVNLGEFSEESETEQMLELLNSGDIRDHMIEKFNLAEHYELDPGYKYYVSALYSKYSDNISFKKTENEAVRIEVLDTDPQMACDMVNGLITAYHMKVRSMHNIKYQEELEIRTRELTRERAYLDSLVNRMSELGEEYGLIDVAAQVEGMFTELNSDKIFNDRGYIVNQGIKNLGKYGPEFKKITEMMSPMLHRYAEILTEYNNAYRELNKEITYSSMVTSPYVSDKKSWPKRSVIVLMSVLLTLILTVIIIGVIENRTYFQSEQTA